MFITAVCVLFLIKLQAVLVVVVVVVTALGSIYAAFSSLVYVLSRDMRAEWLDS